MWSTAPPPVTLVDHFDWIMRSLLWGLGWKHKPGLNKVFLGVIGWRITRLKGQIEKLLAKAEAGTLRTRRPADPERPGKARVLRPAHERPPPNVHPFAKDWPLPRKFGWLIPLVPYWSAGCASQLSVQLRDPKLAALLFAHPVLAAKYRPLCWMLGVERDLLPPPRPRLPRPGPAAMLVAQAGEPGADIARDAVPPAHSAMAPGSHENAGPSGEPTTGNEFSEA